MTVSSFSGLVILLMAGAVIVFIVFARRQIMHAFFGNQVQTASRDASGPNTDRLLVIAYARRDAGEQAEARRLFTQILHQAPDHPQAGTIRDELAKLSGGSSD